MSEFDDLDKPIRDECLLVDGDLVAYQAAAASDGRVYNIPSCTMADGVDWKYKKDTVAWCKANGINETRIKLEYIPEPISHALHNIKLNMDQIIRDASSVASPKVIVYLTGKTNYRTGIHPDYKKNREDIRRPHHLAACKQYLTDKYGAILIEGFEADDLIGIEATTLAGKSEAFVICTLDKDLDTIPGNHYNWRSGKLRYIEESEATRFFYEQTMMGDKTDGIEGLYGIGPKKAAKQIKDCTTEEEMCLRSLELYFEKVPQDETELVEDWIDRVEDRYTVTAQLLFIQKEHGVTWKSPL